MRSSYLFLPWMLFFFWHGWLLPLPHWMPPNFPLIAAEERFYRAADPQGYFRFIEVARNYDIRIVAPDKGSAWFKAMPDFMQESGMFVWDTPTIWINNWNLVETDPGMTMSVIEHELVHVLSRWHPDYILRTEGIAPPPVNINNWRTWLPQELFATNIQLRVAKRLNTPSGVQYAKDLGHLFWNDMSQEEQAGFFATYGDWLEPEITSLAQASSPP